MQVAFPTKWQIAFFVAMAMLAVIFFAFVDTAPPTAHTRTSMHMMKRRMLRFAAANDALPTSADQLPLIKGFANSVTDGWGRTIQWHVEGDEVTFISLGRDGKPGGTGDDADMIAKFRAKGEDGKWANEFCEWQTDPYGRSADK